MITAAELQALGASGNILSLAFDVSAAASQAMNGFNIKNKQHELDKNRNTLRINL